MVVAAIKEGIKDVVDKPEYHLRKGALLGTGKQAIQFLNGGKSLADGSAGGVLAGTLGSSLGALAGLGATAGLSAYLTNMDYNQDMKDMASFYGGEGATIIGKPKGDINLQDLKKLDNKVIDDHCAKANKSRILNIAIAVAASIALITIMDIGSVKSLFDGLGGAGVLGGIVRTAAKMVVGYAAYAAMQMPMQMLGNRAFGLHKDSTHERIAVLAREREAGRAISKEQVLSVFAHHHEQVDQYIKQQYGNSFDKLDAATKRRAAEEMSELLPLEHLVNGFNSGKFNVSGLAFAVEGEDITDMQLSMDRAPKKKSLLQKITYKMAYPLSPLPENKPLETAPPPHVPEKKPVVEFDNPNARGGNVERLGREKLDLSNGYVKSLDQNGVAGPVRA